MPIVNTGKIFYIDGSAQHGLIAATSDLNVATWGCSGTSIGSTPTAIGAGQANTTLIVNGCSDADIAARLCSNLVLNGYSDWFLPSRDELLELYSQKSWIGGFNSMFYWSSSEYQATSAWAITFLTGGQSWQQKWQTLGVRPIRTF